MWGRVLGASRFERVLPDDGGGEADAQMLDAIRSILGSRWRTTARFGNGERLMEHGVRPEDAARFLQDPGTHPISAGQGLFRPLAIKPPNPHEPVGPKTNDLPNGGKCGYA